MKRAVHLATMRSKWTAITLFPLLFLCVTAQDANFGKKVKCYMVDGSVVCPGCNSRAGLTCPRVLPDENKCDTSSTTKAPIDDKDHKGKVPTDSPVTDAEINKTTESTSEAEIKTTETIIDEDKSIKRPTKNLMDMHLYLYRILQNSNVVKKPYFKIPRRLKREAEVEDGTCRWNGDCPCPQICCKNGEGRPMSCKRGIRLPPPWG